MDPLDRQMDADLAGWDEPASRLRQALDKDELALYCQPIAALTGAVRFPMAEVLVRLREEEKAMLPPGEFLPVFEHYRLMPDLDRWVVRKVVQHLAAGSLVPRFAINVSSQTLDDPDFARAVALELVTQAVPGTSLLFEIGESDTLSRLETTLRFVTSIRAVGCGLMVSGFGRRSASFQALKALKPDFVKVDGVVTRKLLATPSTEPKLRAILRVAEVMRFETVAEMVEEQDVLLRLKALGVKYAQGFGIRQPHPIDLLAVKAGAKPV
jgi:EAL domain-containing protein (putative c-di-GMP-specific phosphodiesterase class I)